MKILIAEDEATIRETLVEMIRGMFDDIEIIAHEDGELGHNCYKDLMQQNSLPDLIITDLNMPKMNGLELIKRLREELNCRVPIIVFTGHGDDKEFEKLSSYNISAMVQKPYVDKLISKIESILG